MTATRTADLIVVPTGSGAVAARRLGPDGGPPILLIGGNLGEMGSWRWQVPELADEAMRAFGAQQSLAERHRVVVFDGRGCGASPPSAYATSASEMARDALDVATQLLGPRFHLVGFSLGAAVALEAALASDSVASLTMIAGTAGGRGCTAPESAYFETPAGGPEAAIRHRVALEFASSARARVGTLIDHLVAESMTSSPEAWAASALAYISHDAVDRLETLRTPTLVVTGEEDTVVPVSNARFLVEHLGRAALVMLPGVGHLVPIEAPDRCNELIAEHIAEHSTTGSAR